MYLSTVTKYLYSTTSRLIPLKHNGIKVIFERLDMDHWAACYSRYGNINTRRYWIREHHKFSGNWCYSLLSQDDIEGRADTALGDNTVSLKVDIKQFQESNNVDVWVLNAPPKVVSVSNTA